jgi:magnesium chelatase family protein
MAASSARAYPSPMSLAVIHSRAIAGASAPPVMVECHLANGLPAFSIVGLPEAEVRESRDRVRAALLHSGFDFPARRITVNLAPADLPKNSGRFDLPIALGILAADGQLSTTGLSGFEFVGELSLTGELKTVRGVLAMALAGDSQNAGQRKTLVVPQANVSEAQLAQTVPVMGAQSLAQLLRLLAQPPEQVAQEVSAAMLHPAYNLAPVVHSDHLLESVHGQAQAKLALEIAAAGHHHMLLNGPPGAGKSMLARCLPAIMPPMTQTEAVASAALLSVSGEFSVEQWRRRPLRSPHHSASASALAGGGRSTPKPGEISLAHCGVLFLDELPEFSRNALEMLREPLEVGYINIARAERQTKFPACFQLIAAMNPCPCGYFGQKRCVCGPEQIARYRRRLSGPLLDRIDLQVAVAPVKPQELLNQHSARETTELVAKRVARARQIQLDRQGTPNGLLAPAQIDQYVQAQPDALVLMSQAMQRLHWSARAVHRVLRVARTVADLAGSTEVTTEHVSVATQFRIQVS